MVNVAIRQLWVVFACTVYAICVVPVPEVGLSVTQPTGLLAVHAQPAWVVTITFPLPPDPAGNRLAVDSVKLHDWTGAACVTVTDLPAMVNCAMREEFVVFATTV